MNKILEKIPTLNDVKLTKSEEEAIFDYTRDSNAINNYLKKKNLNKFTPTQIEDAKSVSRRINKIFHQSAHTTDEVVLWRGVRRHDIKLDDASVGDQVKSLTRGFISASLSKATATQFMGTDTCCLLKMIIPANFKALSVETHSHHKKEREVLLPHGCVFVVTKKFVNSMDIFQYNLLLISQDNKLIDFD